MLFTDIRSFFFLSLPLVVPLFKIHSRASPNQIVVLIYIMISKITTNRRTSSKPVGTLAFVV